MSALGYAPHISLLVFDEADPEELAKVALPILRATPPLAVTFSAMSWFLEPKRMLWAAPDEQSVTELLAMHRALHRALPTVRCHPHYALGA